MSASAHVEAPAGNVHAFAAWAAVYDRQRNPLLELEERILARILPGSQGRHILDIGSGTGRWLSRFAQGGPASLCGLDSSRAMLEAAARRGLGAARLMQAELPSIPLAADSADLAIASFVLSYVADLENCASELARVIRTGGDLFISDMHPATAAALGWTRSFSGEGRTYHLAAHSRPIHHVVNTVVSKGFTLAACLEPQFGRPEYDLFCASAREDAWQQSIGMPPIYLLHFRRLPSLPAISQRKAAASFVLRGAHCALGPRERVSASIGMRGEVITSMLSEAAPSAHDRANETCSLDLSGYLLFPGLVNAHDHLEFALFPRLGSPPYRNATEWAMDVQTQEAETIRLHKTVPKEVRLWWGGVRNLLSGVTTMCHHNPLHPALQRRDFPVRVVRNYRWEHSLAFAGDLPAALPHAGCEEPFFIHAGEGVDLTAAAEISTLDRIGALDGRTVLVHGLAIGQEGADLLNRRGSALVVCPSSNNFLFHATHTPDQLDSLERLALGSDSPLTADGDLLDEIRFAHRICHLDEDRLYGMVTDRAAAIVQVNRGEGTSRIGAVADFMAIRGRVGDPADILTELSWRDVELVIVGGRIRLASEEIGKRLPAQRRRSLTPLEIDGEVRWLPGPALQNLQSAEDVLGAGNVRVGGLRVARAEV